MEKKHLRRLKDKYQDIIQDKELITLHIPDDYNYMDEDLVDILKTYLDDLFY